MINTLEEMWKRNKKAKFFKCPNGHAEQYSGEEDGQGIPWRPCSVCYKPMKLITEHILDGRLVGDQAVIDSKKKMMTPDRYGRTNKVRLVKAGTLLSRLLKKLPKFEVIGHKHRVDDGLEVSIGCKRGTSIGGFERNHLVLLINDQHQVEIEAVGAFGWAQEVRQTLKRRCHASVTRLTYRECDPVVVEKKVKVKKVMKQKPTKTKAPKVTEKVDPFTKFLQKGGKIK